MISTFNSYDFYCLSTDTKPVTDEQFQAYGVQQIRNGMTMLEMDTRKVFAFDRDNMQWREL